MDYERAIKRRKIVESVLISLRPKWCAMYASRKKRIEIRKSKPKYNHPFKVYTHDTPTT